jgi:hypothetical protein
MPSPKDWTPLPTCSYELAETIAAIAINLGQSNKYMKAYDAVEGFGGFYQGAAEMGIALEGYAKMNKIVWGEGFDWIATTERVAEYILDFMIRARRLPASTKEKTDLIEASIVRD